MSVGADKSKSDTKDPFAAERRKALEGLMPALGWGAGAPQVPNFMQGPASTIGPLTSTLNESIATGMPTNVSGIAGASRNQALRSLEQDIFPQILERFGMGGQRFGSDAMNSMARTSGDILSNLAVNEANLGFGASEAAANRRLQSASMSGLPMELQKYAMMIPELLSFIMGVTPTSKGSQSGWNANMDIRTKA